MSEVETNSFLTHHEFVLFFLYFFFSEESVGRDVDPDTHFLTFNAIYNTHTHTQKQCSLYNPKSPVPRSSPKLSPRSNSDPPSPTRRWLTAKVRFGREILFLREELITTTKRRHDESFSLSRLDNSQEKIFLHHCVFSRGSIVFFSFRFPRNFLRAHSRALCFVFHFPE